MSKMIFFEFLMKLNALQLPTTYKIPNTDIKHAMPNTIPSYLHICVVHTAHRTLHSHNIQNGFLFLQSSQLHYIIMHQHER